MAEPIEVARLSDVPPSTCRQVNAAGRPVAVFKVNDGPRTHRGSPLGEGRFDGSVTPRPWHGAQFDVTTAQVVERRAVHDAACRCRRRPS
jgi:nitrite reductase/ring-hydroxylating ferredoxin subunit